MFKKSISMATAVLLMASGISLVGATAANATAPVIASTSALSFPQASPTLTVTTSTGSFVSASMNNWDVDPGQTGLTFNTLNVSNGTEATIGFSGTGTCGGTVTVRAKAAAFTSPSQTQNSNTLSFVIGSGVCVAPVIASTSTITAGQVDPTLVITTTSTFRAGPSHTNANFQFTGGTTVGLTYTGVSLSGNTITISLTGTARAGTLSLIAARSAFNPNPGADSNTLQFVVPKVPATDGAISFSGMDTSVTANGSAPTSLSGGSGQWSRSGSISWSPSLTNSRFAAGVVYTATVTLTPQGGTFEGLSPSFFTFAGATSVSATYTGNPRTSATVTIVFPATAGGGQLSACNADLLSSSSTIKGVTFNRGTRQANSTDFNGNGSSFMGSVSLTSSEASGSGITSITSTSGTATWLYVSPSINSWSNNDISTTDNHQNVTFTNGRIFEIRITGSGCTDYYRIRVTVAGSNSGSGVSTRSGAAVLGSATVAQQRQMLAAINASKSSLSATFGNGKAGTLAAFASAGLVVSSEATLARVNAKILLLPADKRSKIEEIEKIVDLENFVERVSNAETRPSISTGQLVSKGFISADNRLKVSLTNALLSRNATSLDSAEKIKAAIAEETVRLQERAKRTAEIKAKIAARKK